MNSVIELFYAASKKAVEKCLFKLLLHDPYYVFIIILEFHLFFLNISSSKVLKESLIELETRNEN